VTSYADLSPCEQHRLAAAPLQAVIEPPIAGPCYRGSRTDRAYAIPNTIDGVRIANRLLAAGYPVAWAAEPAMIGDGGIERGTFVVRDASSQVLSMFARGLHVDIQGLESMASWNLRSLRPPRVALYIGQGVDGGHGNDRADMWWGLERLEFVFARLRSEDVSLQLGVRALSKLPCRLLKSSQRDSVPLRHKAQVHVAAERPDGLAHTGVHARRHGPPDLRAPGPVAVAGSGAPRGSGSSRALAPAASETRRNHPSLPPAANH
jgi:hypothetical protein